MIDKSLKVLVRGKYLCCILSEWCALDQEGWEGWSFRVHSVEHVEDLSLLLWSGHQARSVTLLSEFSPDSSTCGAPPLCNFWAPLCSLLKYEYLLNNVVTFHTKICINAVWMYSPIALHFFKHFERSLLIHFIQTNLAFGKKLMLNLHCLSLLVLLCNFWAPLCSLFKYEYLLNNVVTFHMKICINAVWMHSPIALHFFQTFRIQLARSFYSNKFDVRQGMLNLHFLSLLAH